MGISFMSSTRVPVSSVADAAALAAKTGMKEGDLCYQEDTKVWYSYDSSSWNLVAQQNISLVGSSTVTGSAATSVSITGLDLSAYKAFMIVGNVKNATGSAADIYLEANTDTTTTNYYYQKVYAAHTTIGGGRANSPFICELPASDQGSFSGIMTQFPSGYPKYDGLNGLNDPATIQLNVVSWIRNNTDNVTSLQFVSTVASSIDVGSKFMIWGLS